MNFAFARLPQKVALLAAASFIVAAAPAAQAAVHTQTETAKNNTFGNFSGIAIEYDAGSPGFVAGLTAGTAYQVDSVSVVKRGATDDTPYYLGAYTGFSLSSASSVFPIESLGTQIGVSLNAVDLSSLTEGGLAT